MENILDFMENIHRNYNSLTKNFVSEVKKNSMIQNY